MTTQYAVFSGLPSGLTLTAKLFTTALPDTVAYTSDSTTERTNAKGEYVFTFGELAVISGNFTMIVFSGSSPVARGSRTFAGIDTETATTTKEAVELDSASINAVADQVWDEAYASHNSAGSFGKLLNTIRKTNLSIDGVVSSAVTATTTTFSSNVSAPTGAYEHSVLLFTTGALAGENSPILTYNNTNGVFVVEEAFTGIPATSDEFVIIAGTHVHAVSDIQDGLARTGSDNDTLETLSDQIDIVSSNVASMASVSREAF